MTISVTTAMAVRRIMADIQFDDSYDFGQSGSDAAPTGKIAKMVNTAGAVVSVALIVGIGVWGYRLLVRDVSGVPVVAAIEGPMRVLPKDPGGQLATHQGLSVNRLQAQNADPAPTTTPQLAPTPVGLQESDMAGIGERMAQDPSQTDDAQLVTARVPAMVSPSLPSQKTAIPEESARAATASQTPMSTSEEIAAALALADQIASNTAPLSAVPAAPDLPAPVVTGVISADIAGVSRSPRPLKRPKSVERQASLQVAKPTPVSASTQTAPIDSVASVDPKDVPVGTRLAQLGAFDSQAIAEKEWLRLSARFNDFMSDKKRVIQKAESGGRVFYRLRAMGFEDLSDARRFCAALMAEQAACIPVKVR